MPDWHRRRLEIANTIWRAAKLLPGLRVPEVPEHIDHAAYKCYVFVQPDALASSWSRDRIQTEINEHGVPCYTGSCSEVYLEKAFEETSYRPSLRLANARELGETSLMFLCHPTLSNEHVERTCESLIAVMQQAVA